MRMYELRLSGFPAPRSSSLSIALRRVRARSALAVVMLTARSDEVERVIGLELGADDYLAKPCFPCELLMHGGDTVSTKDALLPGGAGALPPCL